MAAESIPLYLGKYLFPTGKLHQSRGFFREKLRMNPELVEGWVGLSFAYKSNGRDKQAKEAYSQLEKLDTGLAQGIRSLIFR